MSPVPRVSFEFFPPQSLDASFRLWDAVRQLAPLDPSFVSVTYGAAGTTRKLTHEAVTAIGAHYGLEVAAHLTCVDASRAETLDIARAYADAGITQIVALRGDPPGGEDRFHARADGFASSIELIEALAMTGRFSLRVGAYPDVHPEAADSAANIDWLKRKFEAGASSAITQFFFEAETFFRFRDVCAKAGIDGKIIPGILPVANWSKVRRFAARCGARVPQWLDDAFTVAARDGREELLSTAVSAELCTDLVEGGVEDLHFYTLNRPELTLKICRALGLKPDVVLAEVA